MQTDPSTQTSMDVNSVLAITDQYTERGTHNLETVAATVLGQEVKSYGLTAENIKKVLIFIGAYNTLSFIYEKAGKNKFKVLGALVGIYVIRRLSQSSSTSTSQQKPPMA